MTQDEQASYIKTLETIINKNPDIIIFKDYNGKFIYANEKLAMLYGTTQENLIGKDDGDFNPNKEQVEFYLQNVQEIMDGGEIVSVLESSTDTASNKTTYYQSVKVPCEDEHHNKQILVVARDVSDIENKKNELAKEQQRLDLALGVIGEGVWDWDLETNVVSHNAMWCSFFGLDETRLSHPLDFFVGLIHPQDHQDVFEKISFALQNGTKYFSEHRMIHQNGQVLWVQDRGAVVAYDENKKPIRMIGSIKDVTYQKELSQTVDKQISIIKAMFEHSSDAIHILDRSGNVVMCSDSFAISLGRTKEEVIGLNVKEWDVHFDDSALAKIFALASGEVMTFETIHQNLNGDVFDVEVSAKGVSFDGEEYIYASARDISSKKLLAQQSKMATMGEMLSNIAHQWRQPLGIISSIASGMKLQIDMEILDTRKASQDLQLIIENTLHLSQTIDDFRFFLKSNKNLKARHFRLNEVIEHTIKLITPALNAHFIEHRLDISCDVVLFGHKNELAQALLNILSNAKDAMILAQDTQKTKVVCVDIYVQNKFVSIDIYDNGGGIPQKIIQKIFDPYFTTKDDEHGTGIGLYMTREIIYSSFKGSISVSNTNFSFADEACYGAKFTISLPIVANS